MAQRRVQLDIQGDSTAVDAQLLQSLIDPLTHLLRNAVDHGIEDETQRVQAGKPAAGRIELAFEHTGRELRIRCQDDGRGLDEPAVLARAIERGLIGADARPSPAQVARLVLAPGFSTRDAATQLSGRGIGLDVVHRVVARLRGALDVRSEAARGLTVDITLPIALAGLPVLVARTPTHVLALSIRQVEHIVPGAGVLQGDDGEERFVMEQGVMPVRRLDALLGLPRGWFQDGGQAPTVGAVAKPRDEVALLVRGSDGERVAIIAPELSQTRRVVVRPLPAWMPAIAGVEGACVLGDGSAAPVIDLPQLLAGAGLVRNDLIAPYLPAQRAPVCLVVDDSVSVRRSMEAFLRDLGFEVDSAGDGLEALARLAQRVPDLAIVDLEMPRMNGVELASTMRQDVRLCEVPIIMITSRASEKHRRMAVDAGVDVFLTKPYTEDDLASQIRRCLERKALLG
ncbi:MAG: response regulator [Burkholderiaceae bacterium]|nr:response regulator [Burkholderiaceae bacterium]